MNNRLIAIALPVILLSGCGNDEFDDLRAWMDSTGRDQPQKMEPPPQVKQIAPFEYPSASLQDPFQARNLLLPGGLQPDMDRPKQPLEEFPLDALRMVGTLSKPKSKLLALVKDPKGALHTVQTGDKIGQNFGTISKITPDGMEIKELVPDGSGGWLSSTASMTLTEQSAK